MTDTPTLTPADLAALAAEYAPEVVPVCPVCGSERMRLSRTGFPGEWSARESWACSSLKGELGPFPPEIRTHWDASFLSSPRLTKLGDPRVVAVATELAQARSDLAGYLSAEGDYAMAKVKIAELEARERLFKVAIANQRGYQDFGPPASWQGLEVIFGAELHDALKIINDWADEGCKLAMEAENALVKRESLDTANQPADNPKQS